MPFCTYAIANNVYSVTLWASIHIATDFKIMYFKQFFLSIDKIGEFGVIAILFFHFFPF